MPRRLVGAPARLAPGGWAFEFANDGYPDIDDTAEVVLALRRVAHPDAGRLRAAVDRGVAWIVGMQSRDGGWGAFDADNTRALVTQAAVLRLRRGHRPAVGRRHRARRRDAGRRGPGRRRGVPARRRLAAARPGGRRVAGSAGGAPTTSTAPARSSRRWSRPASPPGDPRSGAAVRLAGAAPERGRRLGRGPALVQRSARGSAAAPRPPRRRRGRCWRCSRPGARRRGGRARRRAGSSRTQRADGDVGRAAVHRHRLPRRLLHQLPPLPAGLPDHRARPLRAGDPVSRSSPRSGWRPAGRRRAARIGLRARRLPAEPAGSALAGVAGRGGRPSLAPGDIVVADRVLPRPGRRGRAWPGTGQLADALRIAGLTVHVGAIGGAHAVVTGAARHRLGRARCLAVDMESGGHRPPPGGRPAAVVRAIVDTPVHPLVSRRHTAARRPVPCAHCGARPPYCPPGPQARADPASASGSHGCRHHDHPAGRGRGTWWACHSARPCGSART